MTIDPTDPFVSIAALADAYRDGAARPRDVVEAQLARIAQLDPKIGAYQVVCADETLAAAEAADRAIGSGHRIGPFHGIPFGLKDIRDLEGRVTTGGSMAMKDRVSPATGSLTRRLIASGGIVLGKTKTVECAYGGWGTNQRMGTPWNPWDMETHRVPGGGGGSGAGGLRGGHRHRRLGAAAGGVLRPHRAEDHRGAAADRRDHPAVVYPRHPGPDRPVGARRHPDVRGHGRARELGDGPRPRGGGRPLHAALGQGVAGLRLGALDERERAACSAAVLAAFDAALARLSGLGAVIEVFNPPRSYGEFAVANGRLISAEGYALHGAMYEDLGKPMDEDVRPRFLAGRGVSAADYIHIQDERRAAQANYLRAMRGFDAVLTPTLTATSPAVAEVDQTATPAYFTRPFNYLGMRGLALPTGLTATGLPISLQIVARGGDEAMALRIGAALEAALPGLARPDLD